MMKTLTISRLLTIFYLLFTVSVAAQKISRKEKKILKTVEANNAEAIQFLIDVVNINSGTMNHKGVKKVGEVFGKAFEDIGFKSTWYDMSEVNRAGHTKYF